MLHMEEILARFDKLLMQSINLCESEIEKLFLFKIINYVTERPDRFSLGFMVDVIVPEETSDNVSPDANYYLPDADGLLEGIIIFCLHRKLKLEFIPQKSISLDWDEAPYEKRYRLDFEIRKYLMDGEGGLLKKYCVECDGLEFHKTADQIARDNQRARYLSFHKGYDTLRYLGTEIYHWSEEEIGRFLTNL